MQTLINKINNLAGTTGVSADFTRGNGSGAIVLTQQNYGGNFSINESESSSLLTGTGSPTLVAGANATVTVIASALVNGAVTSVVATFTGGRAAADSGLKVSDTYGNSILLQEAALSTYSAPVRRNSPSATVTAGSLQFQIGANAGQTVTASLGNIRTNNLGNTILAGKSLAAVDVTTAQRREQRDQDHG